MPYVKTFDRNQMMMCSWDSFVEQESIARWMTGGIEPDFRTVSDFRKNNIESMKYIFHEFNRRISGAFGMGILIRRWDKNPCR